MVCNFSTGTFSTASKFLSKVSSEIQRKSCIKFLIYSFALKSVFSSNEFFAILKLWQVLQNVSLQYLQLARIFLCQDSQAVFWQ